MRSNTGIPKRMVAAQTLRTVVSILFILNTVFLCSIAQSFAFLRAGGFYSSDGSELQESVTDQMMIQSSHEALLYFHYHLLDISADKTQSDALASYDRAFRPENSNFFFYFRENGHVIFNNYAAESGRSYYPKAEDFFDSGENATLIRRTDTLTFEGHLKKTLTANDVYLRASRFFQYANAVKYVVLALLVVSAAVEVWLICLLLSAARRGAWARMRDVDRIPMYLLAPFAGVLCALCVVFLRRQAAALSDLVQVLRGADVRPAVYAFFLLLFAVSSLLYILLTTIGVRMQEPAWWRRSLLYRAFAARSFGQRVRTVLTVLTAAQFGLYLIVFLALRYIPTWIYVAAEGAFTVSMALMLSVVQRDMTVYIPQTSRIAAEKRGYVPTDGLSDSGRRHAENINFLSRSASAQMEKRYVNESFGAKLIHNVSHGMRAPLDEVARNVQTLERGDLPEEEASQCIDRILTLSQELKKTIEDMILVSKAATGNLPFELVPTDAGMMLAQAVGELYEQFAEKQIEPVIEQPAEPVVICADGQYMWYAFEGILSVMLENAVAGTRLFLRADRAGEQAVIVFRCTVRADARRQIRELAGMGLSSAKVFAMLQGGTMYDRLSRDTLTAVLRFPVENAADAAESE